MTDCPCCHPAWDYKPKKRFPVYICGSEQVPCGFRVDISHPSFPSFFYLCPDGTVENNCLWKSGTLARAWYSPPMRVDLVNNTYRGCRLEASFYWPTKVLTIGWVDYGTSGTFPVNLAHPYTYTYSLPMPSYTLGVAQTATRIDNDPDPTLAVASTTTTPEHWYLWKGNFSFSVVDLAAEQYYKNRCHWQWTGPSPTNWTLISGNDPQCVPCSNFTPPPYPGIGSTNFYMSQSPSYDAISGLPATLQVTPTCTTLSGDTWDSSDALASCASRPAETCADTSAVWTTDVQTQTNADSAYPRLWIPPASNSCNPCEVRPVNRAQHYAGFPPNAGRTRPTDCDDLNQTVVTDPNELLAGLSAGEMFDQMLAQDGYDGCVGCGNA